MVFGSGMHLPAKQSLILIFLKTAGYGYLKIMNRDLDHNLPAGLTIKIFPDGLKTAKSALIGVGNKPLKVILRGLILKATHGFRTIAAIGMNQATLDTSHDTMTFLGGIKNVIVMIKIGDGLTLMTMGFLSGKHLMEPFGVKCKESGYHSMMT